MGLNGAPPGGNVACEGPEVGIEGLASTPSEGPGREKGGDAPGTPEGGADEGKGGGWP